MSNRDLTVSVCGVVMGVMIGAGSLAFMDGAPLSADVRYHAAPSAVDYSQRAVSKKGVPIRNDSGINVYPTIQPDAASSSSNTAVASETPCDAVKTAVLKILSVYNSVFPNTLQNVEARQKLDAALTSAVSDECGTDDSASSVSSVAAPQLGVNNHCARYSKGTVTYTNCALNERNGRVFP